MRNKLYALIDKATLKKRNKTIEQAVKRALELEAYLIQYRNKEGDFDEKKADIILIKKLAENVKVIANDDINLCAFCDGIHLGQEDLQGFVKGGKLIAAQAVRAALGNNKIFGLSTHNEDEIAEANFMPVNYIGLGAYRKTDTKLTANILGDRLDKMAKLSRKPVAAIGGVRLDDDFKNVDYIVVGSGLYED